MGIGRAASGDGRLYPEVCVPKSSQESGREIVLLNYICLRLIILLNQIYIYDKIEEIL